MAQSFDALRRDISAWGNAHAAAPIKALKLFVAAVDMVADNGNKTILAHFAEKAPKTYLPRLTVIANSIGITLDPDVSKITGIAKGPSPVDTRLRDMATGGESITGTKAKRLWPTEREVKAAAAKEAKEAEAAAKEAAAPAPVDNNAPESAAEYAFRVFCDLSTTEQALLLARMSGHHTEALASAA